MTDRVLFDYQARWWAAAEDHPVRVIEKSRRIGLTWVEAARMALDAAEAAGADGWYVGYNKDMSQEFIRDVGHWARAYALVASEIGEDVFLDDDGKEIHYFVIRFASGFRVTALSSRPANLRGKQGNILIDEAAFHDDLAGLLKSSIANLMWGGTVAIVSTHFGVDSEFNRLVEDVREGRKEYYLQRTTLDDAIADGLCRRIFQVLGQDWSPEAEKKWRNDLIAFYGDDADEELFCVPSASAGLYLNPAVVEDRMDPTGRVVTLDLKPEFARLPEKRKQREVDHWIKDNVAPLVAKLNRARQHFFGMDFGRVSDLSCLPAIELGTDMVRRIPFVVEMHGVPYDQQKQVLFAVVNGLPRFAGGAMDATGNGEYLAEAAVNQYGESLIEAVKITAQWYAEAMPPFKAAIEDGLITYPRYDGILIDCKALRRVNGLPRIPNLREKDAKGLKRHGDFAIAAALGYSATRGGATVYRVHRARPGRKDTDRSLRRRARRGAGMKNRKGAI